MVAWDKIVGGCLVYLGISKESSVVEQGGEEGRALQEMKSKGTINQTMSGLGCHRKAFGFYQE